MNEFHKQALHNKEFLDCIEKQFEKFFDWKITVNFYIAIHLLKALAKKRNKDIGQTHYDIANSLDPGRTRSPIMPMPPEMWKKYKRMFQYSIDSRYQGVLTPEIREIALKRDLVEVNKLQTTFCAYMRSEGIVL